MWRGYRSMIFGLLFVAACAVLAVPPASASAATTVEENHALVVWSGSWRRTADTGSSGAAYSSSVTTGSAVTVAFEGTSFAWLGRCGPGTGRAAVSLDGIAKGVVDLSSVGAASSSAVLWSVRGLRSAHHQVTIRALGSADSSGTGAVFVDAFVTDGRAARVLRRTPFRYPWRTYIVIDKSEFRLYWVKDRWLVNTYKIAHGRQRGWTPSRVWRVGIKYKSDPRGIYGPRKMRLYKRVNTRRGYRYVYTRYLIHGTNQPWVIGTMASHGCIRMYNRDVLQLWPQVPVGTMVVTRE